MIEVSRHGKEVTLHTQLGDIVLGLEEAQDLTDELTRHLEVAEGDNEEWLQFETKSGSTFYIPPPDRGEMEVTDKPGYTIVIYAPREELAGLGHAFAQQRQGSVAFADGQFQVDWYTDGSGFSVDVSDLSQIDEDPEGFSLQTTHFTRREFAQFAGDLQAVA